MDGAQERYEGRLGALKPFYGTDMVEERCYDYITETVNASKPDLIIITGDIVYGEFDDSGEALESFVSFMDGFKIPWSPVFGNHDNESVKGVDWQCDLLENSEYCLFEQKTLTGNGNYSVGLEQDGKLLRVFYMLDSNGCGAASSQSLANGHTKTSAGFGQDQINWYTAQIREIKEVSPTTKFSFAFHIQISAFADAYAKYGFDNSTTSEKPINIDYYYGKANGDFGYLGRNLKGAWDANKTVYNGLKALGVDSIFVGHEHCNSASVVYEGIRFQFGQKSSEYDRFNWVSANGAITGSYMNACAGTPLMGGTVIPLSQDGSIHNPYIYLCEDAGGSIDFEQWKPIDIPNLEEISLNKVVTYTQKTWNTTDKKWDNNQSDIVIDGLSVLQDKTIQSIYFTNETNNQSKYLNASFEDGKLRVQTDGLQGGELKLKIIANDKKYIVDLFVVTAEITTEEQFVSVFLTSSWHGKAWVYQNVTNEQYAEMTYDGYYVLGNDITFSNTYYVSQYRPWGVNVSAIPTGVGFNGIFDGRGYTINNLGITNFNDFNKTCGIFGTIGAKGVIRNVAFVNGKIAGSTQHSVVSYLANGIAGTLENVFVHIDLANSTVDTSGRMNVFAYGFNNTVTLKNCIAYVSGASSQNGCVNLGIGNYVHGELSSSRVINSYLICNDALTVGGRLTAVTNYNETAVKNGTANIVTTGFSADWDLTTYKIPVFTTAKAFVNFVDLKK